MSFSADLTNGLVQALYIVECPCTIGVNEACVATKGSIVTAINIIFLLIQVALAISEFVYGEKVALSTCKCHHLPSRTL